MLIGLYLAELLSLLVLGVVYRHIRSTNTWLNTNAVLEAILLWGLIVNTLVLAITALVLVTSK